MPPPGAPQAQGGYHVHYHYGGNNGGDNADRDAINRESKLNIKNPEPFTGKDTAQWHPFIAACLMQFQVKPVTFREDIDKITFAASYMIELAGQHWRQIIEHTPNHTALVIWNDFIAEFARMFGVANAVAESEAKISVAKMRNDDRFTQWIVPWETDAFQTGWNFGALRWALIQALPARVNRALEHTPMPETYQAVKALVETVDRSYWSNRAAHSIMGRAAATPTAPRTNGPPARKNTQQNSTILSNLPNIPANLPRIPAPTGPRPPISQEERDRRRRERLCLNCGSPEHFLSDCPTRRVIACSIFTEDGNEVIEEFYEIADDE